MLLNIHSYYSLRYGCLSLENIVKALKFYAYDTAVLTDINNSSASLDFIKLCSKEGIKALAGMEFRNGDELLYICIAKNIEGFREINEWRTYANYHSLNLSLDAPDFQNVWVIYPYGKKDFKSLKDNERIGIRPEEINKILWDSTLAKSHYVILKSNSFLSHQYTLHQQLRAIDHNILFSQLQTEHLAYQEDYFIPKSTLLDYYKNVPELIENTEQLLASCSFDFDFHKSKNKAYFTGNKYDDKLLLEKYALEGWEQRYGKENIIAKERVFKELSLIEQLNFSSYFLITDDICRYARHRDFHYVGRGSGANSIVAYCLGITDVCPIKLDLYFERFLNPKRQNPPDFDIDFSWQDRDEIYDYIFKRYQRSHTALLGAMSTFKGRSIIRELGKVYGLPKGEIDEWITQPQQVMQQNSIAQEILSHFEHLVDFPNQRTIHASGILISELPLSYYSAMDYPPKGMPTLQIDMHTAEDIGFEKFDILSQRGIGHIKDCKTIIYENKGIKLEEIQPERYFDDPLLADALMKGETIGCFYIESPAMRQLLRKLRCDNYLTLVAASSIIRPGVASSGMMHAYIESHLNPDKVKYIHPVFQEQLEETYGIMVYQEDVMKIGHHFGGLDLADADVLRRMMSGKSRGKERLDVIKHKFFSHCEKVGHPQNTALEVWRQMESFAGYSFNKAHSASFAVESYQSLFLKCYFPLEFMVSVLNNYGGYYDREMYIHEAKRAGAKINLPCIQHSYYTTTIKEESIFLGFDGILNLDNRLAQIIVTERESNGKYSSIASFHLRTKASLEQLILLIRVGAFRSINTNKKALLWEAQFLLNKRKNTPQDHQLLFEEEPVYINLPQFEHHLLEDIYDEIELLGFPISADLFHLAKSDYRGNVTAKDLIHQEHSKVRIVAQLATWKNVRTKHQQIMKFGTFIDANGDFLETVHFPQSLAQYPLRGKGLYLIEGIVVIDHGFPSIEVHKCALMPLKNDPRSG